MMDGAGTPETPISRREALAGAGLALLGGDRPRQTEPPTRFTLPSEAVAGLAADDRYLYAVLGTTPEPTLGKFSLATGEEMDRFQLPNRGQSLAGIAAGGPTLWTTDYEQNDVYKMDPETGEARRLLHVGYTPTGICRAPDSVWIADRTFNRLRKYDLGGTELDSFEIASHTQSPGGLGWHDGHLWLGDGSGSIADGGVYRFTPDGALAGFTDLDYPVLGIAGTAGGVLTVNANGQVFYRVGGPAVATATATPTATATGTSPPPTGTAAATATPAGDEFVPSGVPQSFDLPGTRLLAVGGGALALLIGLGAYVLGRPRKTTADAGRSPSADQVTVGPGATATESPAERTGGGGSPADSSGAGTAGAADSGSADADGSPEYAATDAPAPESVAGTTFDDVASIAYEDVDRGDQIGGGATGDVYRATVTVETPLGDRTVALKERETAAAGSELNEQVERFGEEVADWARIAGHENVLDIYAWGATPHFWLLTECATAGNVGSLVDASAEQVLDTGVGAAAGLHHAHENDVTHFALDPSSVLLVSAGDDEWPTPKVGDWTLAGSMLEGRQLVESQGLHYVAPEQVDSSQFGTADERTDVYRLGAVLYYLFTGAQPPQGEQGTVMYDVIERDPVPPTAAAPDRDLPAGLDEVLTTALATEMDDRYADMAAFRAALTDLR